MLKIGLDVGSTTIKCVVLDLNDKILFSSYERHLSQINDKFIELIKKIKDKFPKKKFSLSISGSAGMGLAEKLEVNFVQEVYATRKAVQKYAPETDVVIELGGEDAKILFLSGMLEVRMNGTCAGGTGAFIDQMSTLLDVQPDEMNKLAKSANKVYKIASRCGVFAKSDIQPLINQGANKEDISASIYKSVVNQTIVGLAQGREIKGNVLYLGGPLTYLSSLRDSFDESLETKGVCPENSLLFVAIGSALDNIQEVNLDLLDLKLKDSKSQTTYASLNPLFKNREEYEIFKQKHNKTESVYAEDLCKDKIGYIGIDAGSTTVKCVLINSDEKVVLQKYTQNKGNVIEEVKQFLVSVYEKYPNVIIKGACSTGYGEELVKNAFDLDFGLVETMAHFFGASKFNPNVDFIIDIGGQDIKCFQIHNGIIENIYLNEACSSGCGSFLQTFAEALGYSIEEFSHKGLFSKKPVDLGSRCTVFMNSSVKQAQKDGASIEDISAGLSISVVKNALYKVIRCGNTKQLGKNIVVQGGTFLNDAVLRAFEQEVGSTVTRSSLSGLMGAYGASLFAKKQSDGNSNIIDKKGLEEFTYSTKSVTCSGCENRCKLTVNKFNKNKTYIGGNRCDKPLNKKVSQETYDMYKYKKFLLEKYRQNSGTRKETIGLPMGLNMYELLPFWHTFFSSLGFGVVTSPETTNKIYMKGKNTIPSDTACYPAKLMHGHIEELVSSGVDTIFYPCMSYNIDEHKADNCYNCPVVAYYPEVISANVANIKKTKFIYDYLGLHRPDDFPKKIYEVLKREFDGISFADVKKASQKAYDEYARYMQEIKDKGKEYIKIANEKDMPIIVLCGRPYHLDPEVNHGIDNLICSCGAVVVTEDAVCDEVDDVKVMVLNQWTYHSRLYRAAKYVAECGNPNVNLVQLVSFGCGVDAITTDEVRRILLKNEKIYTQIKIDEITNLGAVKIRMFSLLSAIEQQKRSS